MPGNKPCPPGCDCPAHHKTKLTGSQRRERRRGTYGKNTNAPGFQIRQKQNREKWLASNPDWSWTAALRLHHGLTPAAWRAMWEEQNGRCYLGPHQLPEDRAKVHIDHDHDCCESKKSCNFCRRGLACGACNRGIGLFGDSPERLRAAADGLERAQAEARVRLAAKPQQLMLTGEVA